VESLETGEGRWHEEVEKLEVKEGVGGGGGGGGGAVDWEGREAGK
jgi:hypothetical protein